MKLNLCGAVKDGCLCTRQQGHPDDHVARIDSAGSEYHWPQDGKPAAGETCDMAVCGALGTGHWCDRQKGHDGPHGSYWLPDATTVDVLLLAEEFARVSQILRTFVSSQVSLSTLQPVIDLAIELNPDLGLALVCGWCQKVLKAGRYPASHGICEACQLRAFNER